MKDKPKRVKDMMVDHPNEISLRISVPDNAKTLNIIDFLNLIIDKLDVSERRVSYLESILKKHTEIYKPIIVEEYREKYKL